MGSNKITSGSPHFITQVAPRAVTLYQVSDAELQHFTEFNTHVTVFASVGSAVLSLAFGIWTNGLFAEKLTPGGEFAMHVGSPVLMVIGLVFFGLAYRAWKSKQHAWNTIRCQT